MSRVYLWSNMLNLEDITFTKYGRGTIVEIETLEGATTGRYGITHDSPNDFTKSYTNNIMYFFERELRSELPKDMNGNHIGIGDNVRVYSLIDDKSAYRDTAIVRDIAAIPSSEGMEVIWVTGMPGCFHPRCLEVVGPPLEEEV